MIFRYCNLCYQNISVSIINLRKYGKRVSTKRFKKHEVKKREAFTAEERKSKTPIILCKRPMFNFYQGDIYSKYEEIPLNSKGWNRSDSKGDHFCIYPEKTLTLDEDIKMSTFEKFDLDPSLCKKLQEIGHTTPLKIQECAIPKILSGLNTVIAAETGCGKTMAYLIPLIDQILNWKPMLERPLNSPLGLIVTPSRELAIQIGEEAKKLSNGLGISTKILIGGKTKRLVSRLPMDDVDLVVASFGVISKLTTFKIYKLYCVKHIVLDEADALFHESFDGKLNVFMNRLQIAHEPIIDENGMPKNAQLTLASATMPQRISEVLGSIVNVDSLVKVVTEQLHRISVPQTFVRLGPSQKPYQLLKFIKPKVKSKEPVIIFSNNIATCDFINMFLNDCGINNICLNGNMPLELKQGKYQEFKNGKVNVLSTTNIGSRGLDTVMVRHILNYEFPMDTADYIHRCGRVGRVGSHQDCKIVNFISSALEIKMAQKIERAIRKRKPIPIFNIMKEKIEDDLEPLFSPDDGQEDDIIQDINDEGSIPY
ncbi:PREDICTED: probable ATP-dependent RNA helicase DDX28 [Polistes canadensis]|uniref:probable ATP-dependent RNA helicase DDX28 n=1 Tax=Polistes canadensis TaxID=91411 RepID=UPI000718AE6A|nr:PREDICTED: probable ATP-dependent RNA helicase DDX28 [Polistes canadensis]